jgi:hypothetical protein
MISRTAFCSAQAQAVGLGLDDLEHLLAESAQ